MTQTLLLNKKFYAREAIETAAQSFSPLCIVTIKEQEEEFCIELHPGSRETPQNIEREFANHCLAAMK